MINKKQNFSFLVLVVVGFFCFQQNIFAETATSTSSLAITADVTKMPADKVHLGYRAIMVTNTSDKYVTLDSVNISLNGNVVKQDNDILSSRVIYCDFKTTDVNDPKYCAFNSTKAVDVCDADHVLKSGESCFVWFKALRNDKIGISSDSIDHQNFTLTLNTKDGIHLDKHFIVVYQQDLYVAGNVYDAKYPDGLCGLYIWDDLHSSWSLIASGDSPELLDNMTPLALMKGDLYIGAVSVHVFGAVNGPKINNVNNIVQWNGYTWSNVGGGVGFEGKRYQGNGAVNAFTVMNDELYVGGYFDHANIDQNFNGKLEASGLAKWNGSTWSTLEGMSFNNRVANLGEVKNNELYVLGYIDQLGCYAWAHWHDSKWDVDNSLGNTVFANINDDYYRSVREQIQKLKGGNNWQTIGTVFGAYPVIKAFAGDDNVVYIGGSFDGVDGIHAVGIAQRTSSGWQAFGDVVNEDDSAVVTSLARTNNELYVAGKFTKVGNISANKVAKWNGSSWKSFDNGLTFRSFSKPTFIIAPSLRISSY